MHPTHSESAPVAVYEVDINEIRPRTWRVMASSIAEAREKARCGHGEDISGVDFTDCDIVDVRLV